jgi:hypothetical protein
MMPLLPECGCCPEGYTWSGPTPNWPDGVCTNSTGTQIAPIDCETCEDSISANCVFLPAIECLGIKEGTTVADVMKTLFCSTAFWRLGIQIIASDQTTYNGFCNLVAGCGPVPGSTTPIIGPISWSIP